MRYRDFYKELLVEGDYSGDHSAPVREGNAPLNDLTINGIFPDDIYGSDASRMYSSGEPYDGECLSIIRHAHNRPNYRVKVYRAIPNMETKSDKRLKDLINVSNYFVKWKFFPVGNEIVGEFESKHKNLGYDEKQKRVLSDIQSEIDSLQSNKTKYTINSGDWVSLVKQYAIDHGRSNLNNNYKILTKTVYAKNLFTDGNSIQEWGYVI